MFVRDGLLYKGPYVRNKFHNVFHRKNSFWWCRWIADISQRVSLILLCYGSWFVKIFAIVFFCLWPQLCTQWPEFLLVYPHSWAINYISLYQLSMHLLYLSNGLSWFLIVQILPNSLVPNAATDQRWPKSQYLKIWRPVWLSVIVQLVGGSGRRSHILRVFSV